MRPDRSRTRRLVLALVGALFLLLILLILQLLAGVTVPGAVRAPPPREEFSFTVISIDSRAGGPRSGEDGARGGSGPDGLEGEEEEEEEEEEERGASAEQRGIREQVELQPWAAGQASFTAEVERFITFITTPQVQCSQWLFPGSSLGGRVPATPWALCADGWGPPVSTAQPCVSYSFSMDQKDASYVERMLQAGCEVHQFDPSRKRESASGRLRGHRVWLDWRTPRRGSRNGPASTVPRKLSAIMDMLGHTEVHFLNADLESAEWRLLESWAMDGTLNRIWQLLLTVHLHWAGFEVAGGDAEVVRFWYSVLHRLHAAGFHLLHSAGGAGRTVLRHPLPGASSAYSLTWVRKRGPG